MSERVRPLFGALADPGADPISSPEWVCPPDLPASPLRFRPPGSPPRPATLPPPPSAPPPPTSVLPPPPPELHEDPLDDLRRLLEQTRQKLEGERAELASERESVARLAAELMSARLEVTSALEPTLLELSTLVAEAYLEEELALRPELHVALARRALETLGGTDDARLRASPAAYELLVSVLGAPELPYGAALVPIERDSSLEGMGCLAEAGRSRVDALVRTRLAAVREALIHEHRREVEP